MNKNHPSPNDHKTLEILLGVKVFPMREDQDSYLVVTCNNLHKKQLKDFDIEDLRIMIGQDIGLRYLTPKAILELEKNILAEGDCYEGDLLKSVLTSDPKFWKKEKDHWLRICNLFEQNKLEIQTFDTIRDIRNGLIDSIAFLKIAMIKNLRLEYIGFVFLGLMFCFLTLLPSSQAFQTAPDNLSIAILADLLITIPVLYLFFIRKTKLPKFTVVYVFLIGILLAGIILPTAHQAILTKVKLIAIPLLEIGLFSFLIYRVISLKKTFKNKKSNENDFYDNLLFACQETFPGRVGKVLATEISVIYYLFSSRKNPSIDEHDFTYFKKSGIKAVVGVFLFLLLIETFIVHLVVAKWSVSVAWILTILGLYTGLQVLSILRSMDKRLISINYEGQQLNLRYGFGAQTTIPFHCIKSIEQNKKSLPDDNSIIRFSVFDILDPHNVIIHLNKERTLHKIYGFEKKYQSLAIYVDDAALFVNKVKAAISKEV